MSGQGIGAAVKRKEDQRFLMGKGRYTDDIVLPDQAHAVFVRSPFACAAIPPGQNRPPGRRGVEAVTASVSGSRRSTQTSTSPACGPPAGIP